MTVFPHHQRQCELGFEVLGAWFDHEGFRKAWAPDSSLFFLPVQRAVAQICASKPNIDLDGVVLALDRNKKLTEFGGAAEVSAQLRAPFANDPWAKLEELRELAGLRLLRERLYTALTKLDHGSGLDEIRPLVGEAYTGSNAASGSKIETVRAMIGSAVERATGPRREQGQRTISKKLDGATGGLLPGVVWVMAAGTSWGKSSFLCAVANRVLGEGKRPLIVSCEDPLELYGSRMLQIRTGASALRLRDGNLLPEEVRHVSDAYHSAEDLPVFINAIGRPAESVVADIRSAVKSEGISVVLVDYVQAMRAREKQQDRRLDVYYCGRLMTDAIKESGAGGILFSQLTEDASSGKMRARDCEDLHNAAEVLLFGKSDEETEMNAHGVKLGKRLKRWLWVEKVKQGPAKFRVDLDWSPTSACFLSDYGAPGVLELPFETEY